MHWFWFWRKPTQNTRWTFLSWLWIIIVLIFSLVILQWINLYQKRYNIKNHLASISQEVWYRIGIIEPQLAQIVTYGSRYIEQLQNNEHMQSSQTAGDLLRYIDEIDALTFQARGWIIWTYIQKIWWYIDLLWWLSTYTDDILSLLGYSAPQTYVVVLQNTAEVRPNGGFFGSFALVTLHYAQITKIEIIDSYHPARENPDLMIQWPERLTKFLPDNNVYFVWANKIWFTYHDGAHIQQLYEQAYPRQPIRWVIFVDTEMISKILPEFQKAQRERQFTNAATDLIRGWWFGKKELYLNKSSDFIIEHQKELLINGISKLPQLIQERDMKPIIYMYGEAISVIIK